MIPPCGNCGQPMSVSCGHCSFPVFGMLGATVMLARGLLAHQGYDPDKHPEIVAELDVAIGEELLTLGRETLAAHGMEVLGPLEVG